MCTNNPNYLFSEWYHDSTGQCVENYVLTVVSSENESQWAIAVNHKPALFAHISPQQVGTSTMASLELDLRSDDNWDGKLYEGTESILKHSRLSLDFTYLAPTIKGWSRLATLPSVNRTTWQTVGRATMLMLWKLFSILSIPSPFVSCCIQILGPRRGCKNCSWTVYVYYGIYARFLRSCCTFIGIIFACWWFSCETPLRFSKKRFLF